MPPLNFKTRQKNEGFQMLFLSFDFSRLQVATADNLYFYNRAFVLRSHASFLPPTLFSEEKLGHLSST